MAWRARREVRWLCTSVAETAGEVEKGPFAALPNDPLKILLLFVLLSSFMLKFLRIILISLADRLANLLE